MNTTASNHVPVDVLSMDAPTSICWGLNISAIDTTSSINTTIDVPAGDRGIGLKISKWTFPLDFDNPIKTTLHHYPINGGNPVDNRDI